MVFPGDGPIAVDGISAMSLSTEQIYEIIKRMNISTDKYLSK